MKPKAKHRITKTWKKSTRKPKSYNNSLAFFFFLYKLRFIPMKWQNHFAFHVLQKKTNLFLVLKQDIQKQYHTVLRSTEWLHIHNIIIKNFSYLHFQFIALCYLIFFGFTVGYSKLSTIFKALLYTCIIHYKVLSNKTL